MADYNIRPYQKQTQVEFTMLMYQQSKNLKTKQHSKHENVLTIMVTDQPESIPGVKHTMKTNSHWY